MRKREKVCVIEGEFLLKRWKERDKAREIEKDRVRERRRERKRDRV